MRGGISRRVRDRLEGAVFGALVGDALALSAHYEYDSEKIWRAYGGQVIRSFDKPGSRNRTPGWAGGEPTNFHPTKGAGDLTDYGDNAVFLLEALAADPNDFVGAGPYVISNIERGSRIEMEAFDKYYKPGYPKTKKLRFDAFKDENLRVAALEAGDVDIIEYLPWQAMDSVGKNDRLKMDVVNGPFMYVTFNCGKGPFADVRLRQAVGYAIKRSDVIAAAFFGRGNELGGVPLQESSPFYDEKYQDRWTYDPAKAKALMAEAGHPNGFSATLLSTAQYGMHKNTAEVVQQNLAAIGINVQLNLPDWAKRVALGNQGQYDFSIMGSAGDFNDPDALTKFYDGSLSTSYARSVGFEGKRISELFATARQEADMAKRKAMYAELQQLALDEAPIIPINWRAQGYAYQSYLSGFTNIPGFLTFFSGMVIENIEIG